MNIANLCGKHTIDLPGNGISPAGVELIQQKMEEWDLGRIPTDRVLPPSVDEKWIWDWKIPGKGEYVGTLPKRLAKLVRQVKSKKLTSQQLSVIGNIGSAHSGKHCKYWFDIVPTIDWTDGDFGDKGSCFWGSCSGAKDMIVENGGGAIRFFTSADYEQGFARAWLVPWKDCWVVFNGYGMETLPIARVLATYLNHAYYHRAALRNNGDSNGTLWINNGACYVVGSECSVLWHSDSIIDLGWKDENALFCSSCDCSINEDDHYHSPDGEDLCEECWCEHYFICDACDCNCSQDDMWRDPNETRCLCEDCWDQEYFDCKCGKSYTIDAGLKGSDGLMYCMDCWDERYFECEVCNEIFDLDDVRCTDNGVYCKDCYAKIEKREAELCNTDS